MKMTGAIRKQLSAFLEGFYNIIPRRLISIFNEQELELLVSGLPVIDIDDLKANTEYHKYQANSLQIIWFWRALRSFDQTDKAKFMQFVTGSSKVKKKCQSVNSNFTLAVHSPKIWTGQDSLFVSSQSMLHK
jgi:E3 ubiquitin-protein ligase HUWE1